MDLHDAIKFDEKGLVTAIAQNSETGQILMVAYMNKETFQETIETGKMVYWSRSRKERWMKGETSGHTQTFKEMFIDCDGDALLFKIEQKGGACHKGYISCFFRANNNGEWTKVGKKIPQ